MRQLLFAKTAVQAAQLVLLRFGKRPAVGAVGELEDRLDVTGFRIGKTLPECGGAVEDRLAQRLKFRWIGVLRGILPELLEHVDQCDRVAADIVQFVPQAIEFGLLTVVQNQAAEGLVFAMVERERHDFVHRDDLRVAESRGEHLPELFECRLHALARRAALLGDDGQSVGDGLIIRGPHPFRVGDRRSGRKQAGPGFRPLRQHFQLDAAFGCTLAGQCAGGHELAVCDQIGRETNRDH